MSIFRPPAAPQVIRPGIAALLPVTIGPTVPAGSTAATQALAAYRAPAQPQQLVVRAPIASPAVQIAKPAGFQPVLAAWPYAALEQWRIAPEPAPFGGITVAYVGAATVASPRAPAWPYAAAQRWQPLPITQPATSVPPAVTWQFAGQPSWPYAATMLAGPTASEFGIAAVYLGPSVVPILPIAPWPYALLQPAQLAAPPAVAAVPPLVVPQIPGQAWPYASTQPITFAQQQASAAVPPTVVYQITAQPWPYATSMLPEPVSAFFGVTAIYGGAVPVLMGRALPFPYASTMLPVPTSSMWGQAASAVFPLPGQVLTGVIYGPNGNDYTGTLNSGGSAYLRRR